MAEAKIVFGSRRESEPRTWLQLLLRGRLELPRLARKAFTSLSVSGLELGVVGLPSRENRSESRLQLLLLGALELIL